MTDTELADRIARCYYARYSTVAQQQWSWPDYPGRELMILDARRYIQAARDAGLKLEEIND